MLESARAIRGYLAGVSREAFKNNPEKQDAVCRRFEVLGEAASRLVNETQAHFPKLPFRSMKGMRNIIAHDYGDIDLDQVWKTATNDLAEVITTLERHFGSYAMALTATNFSDRRRRRSCGGWS